MEIFKIRNKEGLYYKSCWVWNDSKTFYFHKKGKEFKTLKLALKMMNDNKLKYPNDYEKFELNLCEIVKFETIEKETIKIE